MPSLINTLKEAISRFSATLDLWRMNQDKLYTTAISFLGRDASPSDVAPDEYGCAESVSAVIRRAFPDMRFPTILSTRQLFDYLRSSPSFTEITNPVYGCIIISVTGTGNGRIANGHTGIVGKYEGPGGSPWVMSNNSITGTWEANFTVASWNRYYRDKGGMSTHFFMVV